MLQVNWHCDAEWLLGILFEWSTDLIVNLSFHMCQSEILENTSKRFGIRHTNKDSLITPYQYGLPIDSLPKSTISSSEQSICMHRYQILVESLNLIATRDWTNLTPDMDFLLA